MAVKKQDGTEDKVKGNVVKCYLTDQKLEPDDVVYVRVTDDSHIAVHKDYAEHLDKLWKLFSNLYLDRKMIVDKNADHDNIYDVKYESTQEEIADSITLKVYEPKEIVAKLSHKIVSQEYAKKAIAVALHRHYSMLTGANQNFKKRNMLLIGDTGVGKTALMEAAAELMDAPFVIGDCTKLTEAGYVGEDVENMLTMLLADSDGDISKAEKGIVALDEIDKIARKSAKNPSILRDVSGEGVQQALLKIIEGSVANIMPPGKTRRNPMSQSIPLDTHNILFIGVGSFPGLEEIVRRRLNVSRMGFRSEQNEAIIHRSELLRQVKHEDLIEYGFIQELVGRFPNIVPFETLTKEDMLEIIKSIECSILDQYKAEFGVNGIELNIKDEVLEYIAEKAVQSEFGARALMQLFEQFMTDIYYENIGKTKGELNVDLEYVHSVLQKT